MYPDDICARPIESAPQLKLPRALVLGHVLPLMLIILQRGHSDLGLGHNNWRHGPRSWVADLDVPGGEWLAELCLPLTASLALGGHLEVRGMSPSAGLILLLRRLKHILQISVVASFLVTVSIGDDLTYLACLTSHDQGCSRPGRGRH